MEVSGQRYSLATSSLQKDPCMYRIGGWVGLGVNKKNDLQKRNFSCPHRDSNLRSASPFLVTILTLLSHSQEYFFYFKSGISHDFDIQT
jgi:hypothetical protein